MNGVSDFHDLLKLQLPPKWMELFFGNIYIYKAIVLRALCRLDDQQAVSSHPQNLD